MTRHDRRPHCTSPDAETGCKQNVYETGPDALCYYHRKLRLPDDLLDSWHRPTGGKLIRRVLA